MSGGSSGLAQFKLTYQISPILFVGGGVGNNVTGGMVPVISYTQGKDYDVGLLSQASPDLNLDDFFAHYTPISGSALADYSVGTYPFLNQTTAANAVIKNPLRISMLMTCPARSGNSYAQKLATLTALASTIDSHVSQGGLFNVATPAFLYTNCILLSLKDVTSDPGPQVQSHYVWEFIQPLVTLQQAQGAESTQMNKISSLTQNSGNPPGSNPAQNAVGQPSSGTAPAVVPAARSLGGASASGSNNAGTGG